MTTLLSSGVKIPSSFPNDLRDTPPFVDVEREHALRKRERHIVAALIGGTSGVNSDIAEYLGLVTS